MKLIIFILIVLIIAALLIRIILRSVNQHSPLLMQLHAAGIRTGDAERILSGGEYWQRQKTLLTEREVSFMKGLFRIVDMKRWYLCPQVRVADIVQLNGNIRPRSSPLICAPTQIFVTILKSLISKNCSILCETIPV